MDNNNSHSEPLLRKETNISTNTANTEISINLKVTSTTISIANKIISFASPIIFSFMAYILWSSLVYYCVRTRSIEITEGKAILFMYYYTIVTSIFWGFSIGFEIKGSQAYGSNDKEKIEKLLASNYTIYIILCLFFMILSIFIAPYLVSKLSLSKLAINNFTTEIRLLAFTFPQISFLYIMFRLGNLLQRNKIQNKALVISSIVHVFACLLFIKYLEIDDYGMGLSYFCTYTTYMLIILKDFNDNKPLGINLLSIKPLSPLDPLVISDFIFTSFPAVNYIILLATLEINSLLSLYKSNLDFTVMSIYINIFNLTFELFDALSNSMTILLSYYIGKKDEEILWKIFKITLLLCLLFAFVICTIFYVFSDHVFLLFSQDPAFNILSNKYSNYLICIIFISSCQFVLSEFILVCGFNSFPAITTIILRLGFQIVLGIILIYYFKYGLEVLIALWLIATVISVIIYVLKVMKIKMIGISMTTYNLENNN